MADYQAALLHWRTLTSGGFVPPFMPPPSLGELVLANGMDTLGLIGMLHGPDTLGTLS